MSHGEGEAPVQPGQWSMHMNGPRRLGRSRYVGPQTSNELWRHSTETNYGGAAIGRDGTVYMGTLFGEFLAIRPNGTIKWRITVPGTVEAAPAILLDGRIAFVNSAGTIHVVGPDGSHSWHFETHVSCLCPDPSPAIGGDGTIYVGWFETVYAFHPDGSIRWTFDTAGKRIGGPIAVAPDGVVYLPAQHLFALNPDGTLLWESADQFGPGGSPAIADDGTIYVNAFLPPALWAFDPDGTVKWTYQVADCCDSDWPATPAIGLDGTIYFGERVLEGSEIVGLEVALNPDGTLKWDAHYGHSPTSAAIGADGTIYFGSGSHNPASLYALNPDGTLKWQYDDQVGGYLRTPPAIGRGQRIYAGSLTGFFALGP
jgi:outer membrane protein assembly factor BamB